MKRRIEQLPQVAMADMTGVPQKMLRIVRYGEDGKFRYGDI